MSDRIPEGWTINPLSELANVDRESLKNSTQQDYRFHYIDIASVKTGRVELPSEKIAFSDSPSRARKIVRKGDVLMSTVRPNLQAFAYFNHEGESFIASTGFAVITAKKTSDGKFLYQTILADDVSRQIAALVAGSNYPAISSSNVKNLELVAPPLPEQKKIAAILSSVDEVIEKTRAQIDKLKDLKTGMMQELLTKGIRSGGVPHTEFKDSSVGKIPVSWESYLLGDVFDLKNGVNKDKDAFGHGVPIISYKNVYVGGGILDSDLSALVEMNEKELSRFRVHFGDVFFTRTSETPDEIGFTNVYLGERDDVVFNGFVIRGRQKNNLFHPYFLKYIFQSNAVRKQMMDNSKFTTRAGISGESLGRIAIAVPDISEQKNIANALDSVEARITKNINKINAIQSFKKAMMQDLITGKVRVQIDTRELAEA